MSSPNKTESTTDENFPQISVAISVFLAGASPRKIQFNLNERNNRLTVGRDTQNLLRIDEKSVSRFHAAILLKPNGTLIISDLESANGTFLNGTKLKSGGTYEIKPNDIISFGNADVHFDWKIPEIVAAEEVLIRQAGLETEAGKESSPPAPVAEQKKPASIVKSAGIVSIAVMGSRILGLVREMVFSRFFGAGFVYDAFLVGFRIPNLLRDLFAEGALSAAFVKVFTDYQIKRTEAEAWQLASLIFNALAVVLSAVCLLGILLAPYFVPLLALGFPPEKAALAVTLTQIMFPFILLVALAAVAMGVLNTKGVFGIPASASTAFNIVSIVVGLAFAYWLSGGSWDASADKNTIPALPAQWAIIGMAIGTLIGGAAQLAIQIPSLLKVGFRFSPVLSFTDEGVKRVMVLMGPAIIGTSAVQIKVMVDTFVVSGIDGGNSWLSYAFRLMQFPIGVFGVAIGTAAIPTLSRLVSEGNYDKFRETLAGAINLVFLLTLPSACGLIVLGEPIVRLIFEGGKFDALDTSMTAWALAAYSVGLTGYAAIKVLSPSFYALDDAKTPMYVSLASILVHVVVSFGMMKLLSNVGVSAERPNGFGHIGVALATSTVALVNFFTLSFLMRRRITHIEGRRILASFIKIAIASALMSAVCYAVYFALSYLLGTEGIIVRLIEAFVPIGCGGIVFFFVAKALGVSELEKLSAGLMRKLRRR